MEIIKDPVPDRSDQGNCRPASRLTGRLDRWTTATNNHLDQYGSTVLAGKGTLWKLLEQRTQYVLQCERRIQQLFDEHLPDIAVIRSTLRRIHASISTDRDELSP